MPPGPARSSARASGGTASIRAGARSTCSRTTASPTWAGDRRSTRTSSRSLVADAAAAGYLKTLFLHPPSYEGFDGGAGSRYQARREVRSFWYPTWLAQPAALVPGSRLVDAPPDGLTLEDVRPLARDYELAVLHTSTPSFAHDARAVQALKDTNPHLKIG